MSFTEVVMVDINVTATDDVAIADAQIYVSTSHDILHGYGSAKRNPIDKPDSELGALLATGRALRNLAKQVQKEANKLEAKLAYEAAQMRPQKPKGGTRNPNAIKANPPPTTAKQRAALATPRKAVAK